MSSDEIELNSYIAWTMADHEMSTPNEVQTAYRAMLDSALFASFPGFLAGKASSATESQAFVAAGDRFIAKIRQEFES